ncbi:MAG: anaerobic glycerol-3-phosphate dehydrogenase subunit C [Chloroflexi bacterium]|nr:anaerobic glycerol-3-phosphate dehydrogenase subunit C [Chloroflexota bacterium]
MTTVQGAAADTEALVEELRRLVQGEVKFDKMTRLLYSTDASLYQIEPIGVVLPKSAEDVIAVVETANRHGVPVLPRGGGTSLAGQTVGRAIVMDFSKHMRSVVEVNAEEGWARVQPGIVLDQLNREIAGTGMLFTPDPSTRNRGNVGGALGNNSCGTHSILWGKTVDNIHEMDVVLSNGDTARFGALDGEALEAKMRLEGLEGDIYRKLFELGEANREEILARYPKILRRVSGYNLDEFVGGSSSADYADSRRLSGGGDPPVSPLGKGGMGGRAFDMARFVVGSEGTLVTITEAKLRIVKRPKMTAVAVLHFSDLIESMEATVSTLDMDASAVEHIGGIILRQAKGNLNYSRLTDWIKGDPESVLAVEFFGESEAELASKMDRLEERMRARGLGYATRRLMSAQDQAKVWAVRQAGLGLMASAPGEAKALPFVEDTAVDPHHLPEFVRRFDQIVRSHGTTAGYYGHASVGCLHIRPLVNLKTERGVEQLVGIARDVSDLVLEFGGSMSGEHGDGLVRSVWNEKMFGSKLYEAFREVKRAFDPKGIMNPGKIVDSPPMTDNLRISPAYKTRDLATGFAYREGSYTQAIEMCNGQGECRKLTGTMCPSYMATRDEEHSTRGRANALRSAMSGALPPEEVTGKRLYDVLDLCLECKGCKAECPTGVDMAKLKYEFLDKYHKANGYPLRNRVFGNINALSRLGAFFAPVSNWPLKWGFVREMMERQAGIDRRRELPTFASQTFAQWFKARGGSPSDARDNPQMAQMDSTGSPQVRQIVGTKGKVVVFVDTFTNYNAPELGRAAVKVLEGMGYQVIVPKTVCCGRPMLSKGMMDRARRNARANVDAIYPYVREGAKLVGIEPSCILSFKDDYPDFFDDEKTRLIEANTLLVEEFVLHAQRNDGATLDFKREPGKVLVHGHCHQKALVGTRPMLEVLRSIPGCDVTEIQSGCCGMAGSFGMEKEHYDVSMRIGEQTLFPAIRRQEGEFLVVAEGISCRQQIAQGTQRRAKHLVELLAEAL